MKEENFVQGKHLQAQDTIQQICLFWIKYSNILSPCGYSSHFQYCETGCLWVRTSQRLQLSAEIPVICAELAIKILNPRDFQCRNSCGLYLPPVPPCLSSKFSRGGSSFFSSKLEAGLRKRLGRANINGKLPTQPRDRMNSGLKTSPDLLAVQFASN